MPQKKTYGYPPPPEGTRLTKFALYIQLRGLKPSEVAKLCDVPGRFVNRFCYVTEGYSHVPQDIDVPFWTNIRKLMRGLDCDLSDIV